MIPDKYKEVIRGILESFSEINPYDALIFGEELCNLLMDKVPISEEMSELSFSILEDYKEEFVTSRHIED